MQGKFSSKRESRAPRSTKKVMRIHPASIVCDASSLIALTDAGLIGVLIFLRPFLKGEYIISPTVVAEAIERPLKMPEYAFSAVRLKRALADGVFRVVEPQRSLTDKILSIANSLFAANGQLLRILHRGEAELLAIAVQHGLKTFLVDERTTRLIIEDCGALGAHFEKELGLKIAQNGTAIEQLQELFSSIRILRSTEIIALAHENGYFSKFRELERDAFIAAMYATKFNGCAISYDEIKEIAREIKMLEEKSKGGKS